MKGQVSFSKFPGQGSLIFRLCPLEEGLYRAANCTSGFRAMMRTRGVRKASRVKHYHIFKLGTFVTCSLKLCAHLTSSVSALLSSQLFICQYHIWLAADTRGILVLIPGNPTLNIIVSTFIFVCVAHEISQITTDLAQVLIPKDNPSLLRRLACTVVFFCGLLILSSIQDK